MLEAYGYLWDRPDAYPTICEHSASARLLDKQYRALLEQPVPMLGNLTPRAAARTKSGREKLVQRRVRLSPASAFEGRQPRLSARVCGAGLATGSTETRRLFRDRANRRQYLCRARFQYRSAADMVGENATPVPTKSDLRRD